jgi:tetratricopeptide (TPR) repeat protein
LFILNQRISSSNTVLDSLRLKKNSAGILVLLAILLLAGCSRKKNRFTSRAYHNTTTRYNYFFNAREIKRETEASLYDQHKDDFSELIPLFIYPTEEQSKALYPEMDRIIEKTSTAIDRHSMFIKKKEHNRWIDDCYMLMGIARFYKQEYYVGEEVFEYIAKAYKKEDEKFGALIWLARTQISLNKMNKAESYLTLIDEQGVPKQYNSEFNALYADYYIKKNNIDEAITRLEKSIETTKKREKKRRYNYVLAQLWLKKKEFGKASELFTTVIKLKPKYDMMFNAKINRAMSFDTGSEDSDDIKKMLTKMVKDAKNAEFLDQIYYALADIAFKEKNEPLGIEYLQKSAAASISNNKQKALSYLRLGELFYAKPDYMMSQAYYDSCLTVLPEDYKRYDAIEARSRALNNLVENILIVQKEDSLQKMAGDETYRDQIIEQIIQKVIEEEEAAEAAAANDEFVLGDNNNNINSNLNNTGKWYFYNQTTLGFGFTDFKKNWGNRKLEDNWRRSNKETVATFDDDLGLETDSVKTDSTGKVINEKTTPEYYMQFIPTTPEKISVSHNRIIEALYAQGNIYREDFEDYKNATKSFEELVARYDTCRYKLPSWYNLYRISLVTDNDPMRDKYRQLILDNYPGSEYARIIQDPTYNKVTRENRKRVDNYYSIVFDLFKDRQYQKVLVRCRKAKAIFADNHIQDKFDMLTAMTVGHLQPQDSFKLALENVIMMHPTSEVSAEAKRILALMKKGIKVDMGNNDGPKIPYKHKFDAEFHLVLIIPGVDKRANKYKVDISNFNSKYYSKKPLNVSNIFIDPNNQLIIVKKLKGYDDALDYYKSFKLNKEQLTDIQQKGYPYFLISKENFVLFYKNKDINGYPKFFKKNFEL